MKITTLSVLAIVCTLTHSAFGDFFSNVESDIKKAGQEIGAGAKTGAQDIGKQFQGQQGQILEQVLEEGGEDAAEVAAV